jgi:hypothetical protein
MLTHRLGNPIAFEEVGNKAQSVSLVECVPMMWWISLALREPAINDRRPIWLNGGVNESKREGDQCAASEARCDLGFIDS